MLSEVSFTVGGAFVGVDLEFIEGPLTITLDVDRGMIAGIEKGFKGLDLRGYVASPPLADMHVHLLDYAISEEGWDLDIDSVVGEPYGLKYVLLEKLGNEVIKLALSRVLSHIKALGIGLLVEFRELGIRGLSIDVKADLNHYVLGMPSSHKPSINEVTKILRLSNGIAISSPNYFSYEDLKMIYSLARQSRSYVFVHIAETRDARAEGDFEKVLKTGKPTAIVHGVWLSRDDLELLKHYDIPLILCLRSNRWFLSGYPRVKDIYVLGITVGLGTDNAGWIKPDLWRDGEELLLSLRAQGVNDALWVMKALTTNASRILGIDYYLGEGVKANIMFLRRDVLNIDVVKNKHLSFIKRGGSEAVGGILISGRPSLCRWDVEALCNSVRNVISRR